MKFVPIWFICPLPSPKLHEGLTVRGKPHGPGQETRGKGGETLLLVITANILDALLVGLIYCTSMFATSQNWQNPQRLSSPLKNSCYPDIPGHNNAAIINKALLRQIHVHPTQIREKSHECHPPWTPKIACSSVCS